MEIKKYKESGSIHAKRIKSGNQIKYITKEYDMPIKGARTIAEYAIRRWMISQGFAVEFF